MQNSEKEMLRDLLTKSVIRHHTISTSLPTYRDWEKVKHWTLAVAAYRYLRDEMGVDIGWPATEPVFIESISGTTMQVYRNPVGPWMDK